VRFQQHELLHVAPGFEAEYELRMQAQLQKNRAACACVGESLKRHQEFKMKARCCGLFYCATYA
jgi:hypothetical protein